MQFLITCFTGSLTFFKQNFSFSVNRIYSVPKWGLFWYSSDKQHDHQSLFSTRKLIWCFAEFGITALNNLPSTASAVFFSWWFFCILSKPFNATYYTANSLKARYSGVFYTMLPISFAATRYLSFWFLDYLPWFLPVISH